MTSLTLQSPKSSPSSTLTFLSISATVVIFQLAIVLLTQMQIPQETTAPPNLTEASANHDQIWSQYLELIGRQERSSESLTNPGLRQKIVANWAAKIAAQVDRQIANPDHIIYRQSPDVGYTRAEINGNWLSAIASRGVISKAPGCEGENCTAQGVTIVFNDPITARPIHLRMPSEALQLIALAQAEAAATVRTHQVRPNYNLDSDFHRFFQLQTKLQEAYARLVALKGFPDIASQIREAEKFIKQGNVGFYVAPDGGIYGD